MDDLFNSLKNCILNFIFRYEEAERDCSLSLKLDQTYVKALHRRAAARIELKKYEHAENDLLQVLQYEPKNAESKKQLEKVRAMMSKKEEKVVYIYTHSLLIL